MVSLCMHYSFGKMIVAMDNLSGEIVKQIELFVITRYEMIRNHLYYGFYLHREHTYSQE
jgi:hypothetical protein